MLLAKIHTEHQDTESIENLGLNILDSANAK